MTFDGAARSTGSAGCRRPTCWPGPTRPPFELLPWAADDAPAARMFCDIEHLDGSPFEGDPRPGAPPQPGGGPGQGLQLLRRPRHGVLLLRRRRPVEAAPAPRRRRLLRPDHRATWRGDLRQKTIHTLEAMGIPVEYSHHEDAPSQHEIDLRYTDALTMADNVMTFRLVVPPDRAWPTACTPRSCPSRWRACRARACTPTSACSRATPTPSTTPATPRACSAGRPGLHRRPAAPRPRRSPPSPTSGSTPTSGWSSATRRRSTRRGPATTGRWSSTCRRPSGARRSRPASSSGRPTRPRNPYLAFAVVLAAGLKGIEEGYELPGETTANLYELSEEERAGRGHRPAAASLAEAVDAMERSELVAEALGEHRLRVVHPQQAGRVARLQDPGHAVRTGSLPSGRSEARWSRSCVFPDPVPRRRASPPLDLRRATRMEGGGRRGAGHRARAPRTAGPAPSSAPTTDPEAAFAARAGPSASATPLEPLLLRGVAASSCADLELRERPVRRLLPRPGAPRRARSAGCEHLFWRTGAGTRPELVEYAELVLNLETYQAADRRPAARPHVHGVRAAEVPGLAPGQGVHPGDAAVTGCGATSTTAAPARSTSTSGASGPSSARSTPTSSRRCARSATASARAAGGSDVALDGRQWIAAFAAELGVEPPDDATVEALLDLAGVAAALVGAHRRAAGVLADRPGRRVGGRRRVASPTPSPRHDPRRALTARAPASEPRREGGAWRSQLPPRKCGSATGVLRPGSA